MTPQQAGAVDVDTLEALAKAATPGDWARSGIRQKFGEEGFIRVIAGDEAIAFLPIGSMQNDKYHALALRDAAYIAAANPATTLALIERLRAAEAKAELAERNLKVLTRVADETQSGREYLDADGLVTAFITANIALEDEVQALRSERAKGEGWVSVEERLPETSFHVLVWIPNKTAAGGYRDLASYGDYVCEDESCRSGDPLYVEDNDDGNRKGSGWHKEEETHGGEYDYRFIDLNSRVTHWRPLPAAPSADGSAQ